MRDPLKQKKSVPQKKLILPGLGSNIFFTKEKKTEPWRREKTHTSKNKKKDYKSATNTKKKKRRGMICAQKARNGIQGRAGSG